jgi:hypothetical protein
MTANRTLARHRAAEIIGTDKPLEWFEAIYRKGRHDESIIP